MIDPVTRDYALENGAPVPTDRIEEQAYFILTIPEGNWLYGDPGQGSELWRFKNVRRNSGTEQLYADRVTDALNRQLVDTGRASSVQVSNIATSRYGTSNEIDVTQLQRAVATKLSFNPL